MPDAKKATAKTSTKKRATKRATKRVAAAKKTADEQKAAPPAKRAERLAAGPYPELADPAWVKGNKDAAEKLGE